MMGIFGKHTGLYADFYEFTMAQAFFLSGKADMPARFDYFFRENPYHGGYVVFAGLDDLLEALDHFSFDDEDLRYLESVGLNRKFLSFLKGFRFKGRVYAAKEGEIVFPLEPVMMVEGTMIEAQVIETLLLNLLNFESLIATKASRIRSVAADRRVVDFGLRRAQGLGGIHATKASIIGGFDATSNVYSAFQYSLEVSGTQAHSWIQSFDDELSAFRKFAEVFPDKCVLLVDTYNTLKSGVPNAVTVAKELEKKGHKLVGVRLDSGDLAYLSKHTRAMLDEAGLQYVRIVASNQLDEYVIRSLLEQGAPIDAFGVGTRLVTGHNSASLDGVYKLCECDGKPRLKFSENFAKITLPGKKTVVRYYDGEGMFYADGIALEGEQNVNKIYHPFFPENRSSVRGLRSENILMKVMEDGKRLEKWTIADSSSMARKRLAALSPEHKRFENPHVFKVGISDGLLELRSMLVDQFHKAL